VLAEPFKSTSEDEYQFRTLALVSGCESTEAIVSVRRVSSESRGEFARIPYLLFLRRVDENHYGYAREPFGALSVSEGMVSTYAFGELPNKVPLEQLIRMIKEERKGNR
jgi:hypothetical protein